jgi:hypothetical protein
VRAAVAHWLEHAAFTDGALVTDDMIDVFTTCAQQSGAEHAVIAWMAGKLGFDLPAALRNVTQPVAFLWGSATADDQLLLQRSARRGTCAVISGAGPFAALEMSAETTDAIHVQLETETARLGVD